MQLEEAQLRFIEAFGAMGTSWGITRTMAQIHALLLISTQPLSSDDIMERLHISRGNVNTNVRMLLDWGLAHKKAIAGERKDYFVGEREMSRVIKNIIIARKKRELEPMIRLLERLNHVDGDSDEVAHFREVVKDLKLYSEKADDALDALVKMDSEWFFNTFLGLMKAS